MKSAFEVEVQKVEIQTTPAYFNDSTKCSLLLTCKTIFQTPQPFGLLKAFSFLLNWDFSLIFWFFHIYPRFIRINLICPFQWVFCGVSFRFVSNRFLGCHYDIVMHERTNSTPAVKFTEWNGQQIYSYHSKKIMKKITEKKSRFNKERKCLQQTKRWRLHRGGHRKNIFARKSVPQMILYIISLKCSRFPTKWVQKYIFSNLWRFFALVLSKIVGK